MKKFLIITGIIVFNVFPAHSQEIESQPNRLFALGKIENSSIRFTHFNDKDMVLFFKMIGAQQGNDFGRTAGFLLDYEVEGELGTVSIDLEGWLFSSESGHPDSPKSVYVDEEKSINVTSKRFITPDQSKWVLLGLEYTRETQQAGLMSAIQKFAHGLVKWGAPTPLNRQGSAHLFEVLFGYGADLQILNSDRLDLFFENQILVHGNFSRMGRTGLSGESILAIELPLNSKPESNSQINIQLFARQNRMIDYPSESNYGGELNIDFSLFQRQLNAGFSVLRWNSQMDQFHNNGPSNTTSLFIGFPMRQ